MHVTQYGYRFFCNDMLLTKLPDGDELNNKYHILSSKKIKKIWSYIDEENHFVLTNDFINDIEFIIYFVPLQGISLGHIGYTFNVIEIISLFKEIMLAAEVYDFFPCLMDIVVARDKYHIFTKHMILKNFFSWDFDTEKYIDFLYEYFFKKSNVFSTSDILIEDLQTKKFSLIPTTKNFCEKKAVNIFPESFFENKRRWDFCPELFL